MSTFFQKFGSILEMQIAKEKFPDNSGHNISKFYNVLVKVRFITSKTKFDMQYNKLGIQVDSRVAK